MDIRLAVNKFKAAKTDKERMFYLRTLEAVLKKELEKTRRVTAKLLKSNMNILECKNKDKVIRYSVSV
jgi:hypothetical protein